MACELIGRNFQWHFLHINEKLLLEAAKGRPRLAQIIREVAVKIYFVEPTTAIWARL